MNIEQMLKELQFKDIPRETLASILSTNDLVKSIATQDTSAGLQRTNRVAFIPEALCLSCEESGVTILSEDQRNSFRTFVRAAQDLANANACASVLAGQGSEGDEYGDVGLILGQDVGKAIETSPDTVARAKVVLAALDMDQVLSKASDPSDLVSELKLSDTTGLPESFKCKENDPLLAKFREAEANLGLTSPFAFSVDCSALQGGVVLHVLLGRIEGENPALRSAGNQTSWIGLLGVGIWS